MIVAGPAILRMGEGRLLGCRVHLLWKLLTGLRDGNCTTINLTIWRFCGTLHAP